jgi:hypothetical protein
MEIQREGRLITWFSANLESGIRRWAAVYEYEGSFFGQSTDAGQTGPCTKVSGAFAVTISDVDISSIEIGAISIPANGFIELLKKELGAAKYGIPGLDLERIKALAEKMPSGDHIEKKGQGDATLNEFLRHRELANAVGSTFKLWPGEDPDEWEGSFLDLLNEHGACVHKVFWDSGGPGAGADVEYIEEFLGHYWARTSTDGHSGPYESFEEVFRDEYFRYVSSATEQIWCYEMTTEELLPKLILDKDSLNPGFRIEINDDPYELSEDFRLIPVLE